MPITAASGPSAGRRSGLAVVALFAAEDGREGLTSFIERREARFVGR